MELLLLDEFQIIFNNYLDRRLKEISCEKEFNDLLGYTPQSGGKRLRPYIIYLLSNALGLPQAVYMELGLGVELFHSGSLIQDDLPSLDNDDFRRGRPSLHKYCGEGSAMLIADYLMLYPGKIFLALPLSTKAILNLLKLWYEASLQVIEGEFFDVNIMAKKMGEIEKVHRLKTASLFGFCFSAPFVCAERFLEAFEMNKAGIDFGRAFQIFDDIKDKLGKSETLGKTPGKDEAQNRPSILKHMKVEDAKGYAERLYSKALEKIKQNEVRKALITVRELIEEH